MKQQIFLFISGKYPPQDNHHQDQKEIWIMLVLSILQAAGDNHSLDNSLLAFAAVASVLRLHLSATCSSPSVVLVPRALSVTGAGGWLSRES